MTTTPGAVRGILVVGARRPWTLQATALQCTTTPSTAVRILPPTSLPPPFVGCLASSWASAPLTVFLCSHIPQSVIIHVAPEGFLWASISAVIGVWGKGSEVVDSDRGGSGLLQAGWFIEMERWWVSLAAAARPASGPAAATDVPCCEGYLITLILNISGHWKHSVQPGVADVIKSDLGMFFRPSFTGHAVLLGLLL